MWLDYSARQAILPGVRKVAQPRSAESERSKTRGVTSGAGCALDDGCCAADFIALGSCLHVSGGLINLLLVVVLVRVVMDLLSGRRGAVGGFHWVATQIIAKCE